MYVGVVGSIILGGLLGLILPRLTVRRDQRQSADYLFGALTGAALIGSLWSALTVFGLWRHLRFEDSLKPSRRYVVVLLLAAAHFGLVVLVCWLLRLWIAAGQ